MLREECLWLLLLTGALGGWPLAGSAPAATFLLNSTSDLSDVVPGDGSCSTGGTVDLGSGPVPACGLRAAIQEANALPGPDRIGVHSAIALDGLGQVQLAPIAAYPTITDTLTIDGTEVPGYDRANPNQKPLIQIDGAQTPAGSDGLRLSGSGHAILALAIYRFPDDGIVLAGADAVLIQGCHVGVRRGAAANGNGGDGIEISGGDFNTIGQTFDLIAGWTGRGNVVSANAAAGIRINGDANLVAGNRIGTDPTGAFVNPPFNGFMGNGDVGVHILAGFGNEVGGLAQLFDGTPHVSGNLISGNRAGVVADVLSGLTSIRANRIGTNAAGTSALGNTDHGILVDSSPLATIGGFGLGGNLVAGTTMGDGIEILDSSGSLIVGNTVGLSADQSTALLNDVRAIGIDGGSGHGVFHNVVADDNVGILLENATDSSILANRVGNTQAGGVFGGLGGIEVRDSEGVEVGIPGAGNIVGPATFYGIALYTSSGISLEGNWVGVDPSGAPLHIGGEGFEIVASSGNSIGSGEPGAGNVVGNAFRGIRVASSASVDILGNLVGTEGTGQDVGNTIGIHLDEANANRIGGDGPDESNTVAFSSDRGIWIRGSQNAVEGNFVGTDAVGRVMGNEREGIEVEGSNNRIGVEGASGAGNTIAYSGSAGILVTGGTGMVLVENSIFGNGGLGIDLAPVGATPNDPGDADTGPNGLQNFPEVVAAGFDDSTGEVVVDYTLDTPSGASPFQIDFYLADVGAEEGETWIGRDAYAAGGVPQQARFAPPSGVAVDASSVVVLTATGPGVATGPQTSEFGPPVPLPEAGGAAGLGAGALLLSLLWRARARAGCGRRLPSPALQRPPSGAQ